MAFCKHCGNKLEDGAKFCPKCGNPTNGEVDAPKSDGNDKNNEDTKNSTEKTSDEEKVETKSGFKKYLPYILSVIVLLGIIGYFNSKNFKGKNDSQSQLHNTENDAVIANYDEGMVYQGEYVFDAALTDAALEKNNVTFVIKIDGNNISIPIDDGKTMTGHIYADDLGIEVGYDYGDDLHYTSMRLTPNDKEGKEWVGEYHPTGILFNVVMKLKECRNRGEVVKVTNERKADDIGNSEYVSNEEVSSGSTSNNVDYSHILNECQAEITSCQREIESLCRTFGTLASNNDIDMMKYGQMKMTFINGVNDWLNKANKAFDKCSRDLQQVGVNNAVSAVNQEKHQFNRAINELKSKTLQQVEMSY